MILAVTVAAVLALIAIWLYLVRAEKRRYSVKAFDMDESYKHPTSQLREIRRVP